MGDFFPLAYFPESYFPEGYFTGNVGTGTSYADAALTATGTGSAILEAAVVVGGQLPATPVGGASGGFGRVWMDALRRHYADAALQASGTSHAHLAPALSVDSACVASGYGSMKACAVAEKNKSALMARQRQDEFWLLMAA